MKFEILYLNLKYITMESAMLPLMIIFIILGTLLEIWVCFYLWRKWKEFKKAPQNRKYINMPTNPTIEFFEQDQEKSYLS